jgi:cytochrome oxidase Cu insertion factor (SCO1/SenC/PrrC family)
MRRSLLILILCLTSFASACGVAEERTDASDAPSSRPPTSDSGGDGNAAASEKAGPENPAPENPAPDFEVTTFSGETFALGEQRGTPVVLNFWESW